MPSCAFIRCTNSSKTKNKDHGITFHSFPQDEIRVKWLQVVRKQRQEPDWVPTSSSRICSIHFRTEDMYKTNKGYQKILKDAVPVYQPSVKRRKGTAKIEPLSPAASDSESVLGEENIYLKRKIRDLTIKKKKLTEKVRKLQRKNRIITQKCESLTNLVKSLKPLLEQKESGILDQVESKLPDST